MPSSYSLDLNESRCIYVERGLTYRITPEDGHVYDGEPLKIIVNSDQVTYETSDQGLSFSKMKFAPQMMVGYIQDNIPLVAISFQSNFPNLVNQFVYEWPPIGISPQILPSERADW